MTPLELCAENTLRWRHRSGPRGKGGRREPIDLVRHGAALRGQADHRAQRDGPRHGFQGFIDSEGWQELKVAGPEGEVIPTFEGLGNWATSV
jgi:hypothetical protein